VGRLLKQAQRGDTIVEVLIAVAIAGSVLGITLATMNRNLRVSQATEEHSQGTRYAMSQLEALKKYTDDGNSLGGRRNFCFNEANEIQTLPDTALTNDLDADPMNNATYNAAGVDCTQGTNLNYRIGIKNQAGRKVTVYVRWEKLGGGRDQALMTYKTVN